MAQFEAGQEIETTVVQISNDTVFIDLGLKSEGFVDKGEFIDENGNLTINEGDKIKVYYLSSNRDELHFTTKLSGEKASKSMLESAFKSGLIVEGHVEKEIKGGYEVKIGDSRAFCPYSQMGFRNREETSAYVNKHVSFIITEYKNDGKNIIVSNRRVLENAENEKLSKLSQSLTEGTIVKGTIKSIQSYGAFVDIDGFQALLPASEVSHQRINDLNTVLSVGQTIEAKIIGTDWDRQRVSVSLKALESDPWDSVKDNYSEGDKFTGKIVRIAAFGLFVNIGEGIDGLVHISELNVKNNTNLNKVFKVGDTIDVVIQKIEAENKRISLRKATSVQQDDDSASYLNNQKDDGETYNPFAALLKK